MAQPALSNPDQNLGSPRRSLWRGVLLGLAGVAVVSLFTPFNNYPLNNTDFIGNHLPLGVVLLTLSVVLLINAPLNRWLPRAAFNRAELTIALSMTLVASAFPSVGIMRYLPGHLTSIWVHAADNPTRAKAIVDAQLPDWLFPRFDRVTPEERGNEDVARGMSQRIAGDDSTFVARIAKVPWSRWVKPAIAWGVFLVALSMGVVFLAALFHHQWADVERLPFPLAGVWTELIEPPAPGRSLNTLLSSRAFWIAAGTVFAMHGWNAIATYQPEQFARLPLGFSLYRVFADPPLVYSHWQFREQAVFFTVIGLMCFVRGSVSFSLWFCFVLHQAVTVYLGTQQIEMGDRMTNDQHLGAASVMACVLLWMSRRAIARIGQLMLGAATAPHDGPFAGVLRLCGWGLVVCAAILLTFLVLAGMSFLGAAATLGLIAVVFLLLARVIAETGMVYVLFPIELSRPMVMISNDLPASIAPRVAHGDFFRAQWLSNMFTHDTRQAMAGFAVSATKLAEPSLQPSGSRGGSVGASVGGGSPALSPAKFLSALLLAIVVAYVLSGAASLYVRYNYPVTLDRSQAMLDNNGWGGFNMPRDFLLDRAADFKPEVGAPVEPHSRTLHVGIGAGIASVLYVLRLRFAGWPIDPVGYLLCATWGIRSTWFSIFLGWTTKVLAVHLAGARGLRHVQTIALGLIVGESTAAATWVLVSFAMAMTGLDYNRIQLLPA